MIRTKPCICVMVSLVLGFSVVGLAAPATGGYHLIKTIPLDAAPGGGEYFDYITIDSAARRVYVSHGTEVKILDADNFNVAGTITGFKRNHGVALVPELHRGFVSDGSLGQAIIFDLTTLEKINEVKADQDADSILYDPASKRIFVFNGDPKSATVIDPATGRVITTLALGGAPEQAVADGQGMIYDNLEDTNEVIAIDSRALRIKSRWPVAPAGQPTSIAMDRKTRRLFVAGRNPKMLVVMDADTGKVAGSSFPIGEGVDTTIFDPETNLVASSTRNGAISILHEDAPDKLSPVETVKTEFGAKTMGLDAKTHNLFVDTADFEPAPTPAAGKRNSAPRPKPGTFRVLVYGR